ncbi:MAG: hypothetical protein LBM93_07145, partial [Oscillospiraceae bacterium]|nr:hypothetical protein [Oscillospiraceae bacterium]
MKKLKTTFGGYFSFHLQCDTDFGEIFGDSNKLGFNEVFDKMNENQKQTFAHEFIHYLQNI